MYIRSAVFTLLFALPIGSGPTMWAQSLQQPDTGRKVVRRVQPEYPMPAKRMKLGGTVKLVAEVATDGSVRKVEPLGGSPLLLQAAETAVGQWKYVAGPESKETVEIRFTP